MYRVFFENTVQIFGLSLPELLNIGCIAYIFVLFAARNIHNKRVVLPFVGYMVALLVYLAAHMWNILHFDESILNGADMSVIKEAYYICRVYLVPLVYFYILICSNIGSETFERVNKWLSGFISAVIVVTNFFKVGFITYASTLDGNTFINRSIFDWFTNPDLENPSYMASKGWFYMGNQIGIILFILFPLTVLCAVKKPKISNFALVALQGVAMIMVGTKVSAVGMILILLAAAFIVVLFSVIFKQLKVNVKAVTSFLVVCLVTVSLFAYSPMLAIQNKRTEAYSPSDFGQMGKDELIKNLTDDDDPDSSKPVEELKPVDDPEKIADFAENLRRYHYGYGIEEEFIELFSVEENIDFWWNIVFGSNVANMDFRDFKQEIYEEVLTKNDRSFDRWLGIGYTSNFPYTEKDLTGQNVWFGYIGTLLLIGPYLLCLIYIVCRILKNYKTHLKYENAFFAVSLIGSILLSLMAGHLFFGVFSITIYAWVLVGVCKYQSTFGDKQ